MFQRYQPTGKGKKVVFADYARLTKHTVRISQEFWENNLNSTPYVALFYDVENRKIGFLPAQEEGSALKVQLDSRSGGVPTLHWEGFLKQFSIYFDSPVSARLEKEGNLWICDTKKCYKILKE